MFTMVESRITISWAMATMNRISQRWSFRLRRLGPQRAMRSWTLILLPVAGSPVMSSGHRVV